MYPCQACGQFVNVTCRRRLSIYYPPAANHMGKQETADAPFFVADPQYFILFLAIYVIKTKIFPAFKVLRLVFQWFLLKKSTKKKFW